MTQRDPDSPLDSSPYVRFLVLVLITTTITATFNLGANILEESAESFDTDKSLQGIPKGELELLECEPTFKIYEADVKDHQELIVLVHSGKKAISLGSEMIPDLNTERLWKFVRENNITLHENIPQEVYLYNWMGRVQGTMIFDVGVVLEDEKISAQVPAWLEIKTF